MINKIQLKNFKSIQHINIMLQPINILLGQNGAGKSNFIHLFKLMNKLLNKDLQLYVAEQRMDRLLYFGRRYSQLIDIHLQFNTIGYGVILLPSSDDRLVIQKEYVEWSANDNKQVNGSQSKMLALPGALESSLPKPGDFTIESQVSSYLDEWKIYHFHDTIDAAPIKNACDLNDNYYLRPQAENLAAFLYAIKETSAFQKILSTVQRVAPFIQNFVLKPDKLNPQRIRLRWKHFGSDDYLDAYSLSDGTLRFISLTTLLLQPVLPGIILLDEPELGLHPYAIQLLAGLIQSVSHQTQIIVSTQSVTLANEFDCNDIVVVKYENNASTFIRLDESHLKLWLEQYAIGDIWQKNLIGGVPTC